MTKQILLELLKSLPFFAALAGAVMAILAM